MLLVLEIALGVLLGGLLLTLLRGLFALNQRKSVSPAPAESRANTPVLQPLPTASIAPPSGPAGPPLATVSAPIRLVIQVGGLTFEMASISAALDVATTDLYQRVFSGRAPNWPAFRVAVADFVRSKPSVPTADNFLETFTPALVHLLSELRYDIADDLWQHVITAVTDAEAATGTAIHKGTGYYFWAGNALARGDLDRGLFFMHEALVEDVRTYAMARPTTPAASVVMLDDGVKHPFAWWVVEQVTSIDYALKASGASLRVADLRTRLFPNTDLATVFLFVHANASLSHLAKIEAAHRDNDFVGRIALGHLFHLTVVIERAMKARSGITGLFNRQVSALSQKAGGQLHQVVPGVGKKKSFAEDINDQQQADPDLTLRNLAAGSATYGGSPVQPVDVPLSMAYVVRNVGAHSTAAPPFVAESFVDVRRYLLSALATCVQTYY